MIYESDWTAYGLNEDSKAILEEWKREWLRHPMNAEGMDKESLDRVWDESAPNYDCSRYSSIVSDVVAKMDVLGLLGGTVMDIGCGTGAYAIPFSPLCSGILAVDGSEPMLDVLRRGCEEHGITNVETLMCDCKDIPGGLRCDTAFSSLCPAMNSPSMILSMERLGDRRVYISSYDKGGDSMELEIWRELGHDYSYGGYLTDYPRRFLESLGRSPSLYRFRQKNRTEVPDTRMKDNYRRLLSRYRPVSEAETAAIDRVVSEHSVDGIVTVSREMCVGMLVW